MARPVDPQQAAALRGRWLWLFPASYALHIAEEGLAGERFYRWIGRVSGRELSPGVFAGVNMAYEAAMVVAVREAQRREDAAWIVPALGTVTAVNGIGHLVGSVATRSYSPGVVSGVGVWAPLGLFAVIRSRRLLPGPAWRRGVGAGVLMLGSVVLLAVPLSRKP
jgi:Protein of unknown function with HXXEE motif